MLELLCGNELHLSVDMETLAASHTCPALLSIGAVAFNPDIVQAPEIVALNPTFHAKIQPGGQVARFGREVEQETLDWWQAQDGAARVLLAECEASTTTLDEALRGLSDWISLLRQNHPAPDGGRPVVHAWSYGSKSDLTWWATACEGVRLPYPIGYRGEHCLRTLAGELPFVARVEYGVKHDALHDAIAQAAWVQRLRGALRNVPRPA